MSTAPLCVDCLFYRFDVRHPHHRCVHPSLERSLVTGETGKTYPIECVLMRGSGSHCGKLGVLFEPRPKLARTTPAPKDACSMWAPKERLLGKVAKFVFQFGRSKG